MNREGTRGKKVAYNGENGSSQGLPVDLNLLYLQNSANQENVKSTSSPRSGYRSSKMKNKATKLDYSKSACETSNELTFGRMKARRTVSAPDSLEVPTYDLGRFSFERPIYEHSNTIFYDDRSEHNIINENKLPLGLKLPALRIHPPQSCKKLGLQNKSKPASTAGVDFHLPYLKGHKFHH